MRIGLDVMGGDYAPRAVVEGVLESEEWRSPDQEVVLFGVASEIQALLRELGADPERYTLVDCPEVITMSDHPTQAIRSKERSSIVVGFQYLAAGKIDGFASAGNTGAMMAGTMAYIGKIPGLARPCIAAYVPVVEEGYNLIMDVGLNPECKADVLLQYAMLGSQYSQFVLGVEKPRVGLINIGAEDEKGSVEVKNAHRLMRESGKITFAGNVEGNELFTKQKADVLICDGFVGNIILKQAESFYMISRKRGLKDAFFDCFNFEHYGGTPVLGVNAPVIIGHGISNGRAINNMIRQTGQVIETGLCAKFKSTFSNV